MYKQGDLFRRLDDVQCERTASRRAEHPTKEAPRGPETESEGDEGHYTQGELWPR